METGQQMSTQERVDRILTSRGGFASKVYNLISSVLIISVCCMYVLETSLEKGRLLDLTKQFEFFVLILFFIDYGLRFWAKCFDWKYLFTPFAIIDLVTILPLFVTGMNWHFLRSLRLVRILRLIRVMEEGQILSWKITELRLRFIRIILTLLCILFISAGLIFEVEHNKNPEVFSGFFDAFYFSFVSLSTVGYGDIVPGTVGGRWVTMLMIVTGGTIIPWQITLLIRTFFESKYPVNRNCKHCPLLMHDMDANFCKLCGTELPSPPQNSIP
jgi:voltage-gated potassium channel